jgi:hypothetical protein
VTQVINTRDTVPLSDCIASDFAGQPLGSRVSTNPVQAPPLEVIDLIDFDMEDGEVPIPTISSQWDIRPELILVVPFIVQDSNTVFNGVNYIVAQKIVPMFIYFSKIGSVWNADIIQGSMIYVQQTTSSWLSNKLWVM